MENIRTTSLQAENADFVVAAITEYIAARMILDGLVGASAIDSTVLEQEYRRDPAIRAPVRILETLGPSPIPPWVVLRSLSPDLRRTLRELLLGMHRDPDGRAVLDKGHMTRFAHVEDTGYDTIRDMARVADSVRL